MRPWLLLSFLFEFHDYQTTYKHTPLTPWFKFPHIQVILKNLSHFGIHKNMLISKRNIDVK